MLWGFGFPGAVRGWSQPGRNPQQGPHSTDETAAPPIFLIVALFFLQRPPVEELGSKSPYPEDSVSGMCWFEINSLSLSEEHGEEEQTLTHLDTAIPILEKHLFPPRPFFALVKKLGCGDKARITTIPCTCF